MTRQPHSWLVDVGLWLASGVILLAPVARFWNENEDYQYGWGVPFLALYLAWERWRDRPKPHSGPGQNRRLFGLSAAWIIWGGSVLAARLVLETEPASRPLLWLNTCLLAGALLAWTGLLGGRPWLRHFTFPVIFLLVGVPWIFGWEFFVTQNLMRLNAATVAWTLNVLGEPARAAGNTIILATGQLGVTEACSGIRSLQAALMMSLFFGEFYRYRARGRVVLVLAGFGLALLGNFVRLLYLAWQGARAGVDAVEAAHDSTGWLILFFTVLALWLAGLLLRPSFPVRSRAMSPPAAWARRTARTWAWGIFSIVLLAELSTQGWYDGHERSAPRYPTWSVTWPEQASDFQSTPVPDSARAKLHAAAASAATWRDTAGGRWSGLWIRYAASAEGKVVFESHNPGLCLPAAGWTPAERGHSFPWQTGGIQLQVESLNFTVEGTSAHVFWIPYLEGGVRADADRSPGLYGHSLSALTHGQFPWLEDVWAGCRGVRAETLELALIGPANAAQAETAFRRLLPQLIRSETPGQSALAANGQ